MGKDSLRILQWNARTLLRNLPYLEDFLGKQNEFDALCIQGPECPYPKLPKITGFHNPFVGHHPYREGAIGVVTYVREGTDCSLVIQPNPQNGSILSVEILGRDGQDSIFLTNLYFPKGDKIADWVPRVNIPDTRHIVVGDFNEHSYVWEDDCRKESETLRDAILESRLTVLNEGCPTRIPDYNQRPTAPDISMVSDTLADSTSWEVHDDPLGSDHCPIILEYANFSASRTDRQDTNAYDYTKADWQLFRETLDGMHIQPDTMSIEELCAAVTENIKRASDTAIPKKKVASNKPNNPWWNEECNIAVKAKHKSAGLYRRHPTDENFNEMKQKKVDCKRTIATAKSQYWTDYISSLPQKPDLGKIWDKVKKLKGTYNPPDPVLIDDNKKKHITAKDKADLLADTFAKVSCTNELPTERADHRRNYENNNPLPAIDMGNKDLINQPLTDRELAGALNSIKNLKVAAGSDVVTYRMIQELTPRYRSYVLTLYQACWDSGTTPQSWKHAVITPLHKHGKPRGKPASYRPVSLTSHLGKIYERIIKNRLYFTLESGGHIPKEQAGFRKRRSVADHTTKLATAIKKARARKRPLHVCLFDISRAFDTVWHHKLLEKCFKIGLQGKVMAFIQDFLRDRSFAVQWRGIRSNSKSTDMGVPQGSVIAPILFSIMMADIVKIQTNEATLVLFADDVALWQEPTFGKIRTSDQAHAVSFKKKFQQAIDNISRYMKENGFALSPPKTQLLITRHPNGIPASHTFSVDGVHIPWSLNVTYLGITYNWDGSWSKHVHEKCKQARKAINLVKAVSGTAWGKDSKVLVMLSMSLVRSRLCYGAEALFDLKEHNIVKLTGVDCSALRIATGLALTTPTELVYRESGVQPLIDRFDNTRACYYFRRNLVPNSLTDEDLGPLRSLHPEKEDTYQNSVEVLLTAANIKNCIPERKYLGADPPWQFKRPEIHTQIGNISKRDSQPLLLATTQQLIDEKYRDHTKIYTDGSLTEDGMGAAFCIPEENKTHRLGMKQNTAIMSAELLAIEAVLDHLLGRVQRKDNPPSRVVILSDSKSGLQAIQRDDGSAREKSIRQISKKSHELIDKGMEVVLQWVPSHIGLRGNDLADRAAKQAASGDIDEFKKLEPTYTDLSSRIKQTSWKMWQKGFDAFHREVPNIAHDLPSKKPCLKASAPYPIMQLMRRLRTDHYKTRFLAKTRPQHCSCGRPVRFRHVVLRCGDHEQYFNDVRPHFQTDPQKKWEEMLEGTADNHEMLRHIATVLYHLPVGVAL